MPVFSLCFRAYSHSCSYSSTTRHAVEFAVVEPSFYAVANAHIGIGFEENSDHRPYWANTASKARIATSFLRCWSELSELFAACASQSQVLHDRLRLAGVPKAPAGTDCGGCNAAGGTIGDCDGTAWRARLHDVRHRRCRRYRDRGDHVCRKCLCKTNLWCRRLACRGNRDGRTTNRSRHSLRS